MNRTGKNYDDMTLEELQQEFREAFFETDIIDDTVNDELEELQDALCKKRPVEFLYTPEESWEHYLIDKAEELEPFFSSEVAAEAEEAKENTRMVRFWAVPTLLRRVLIAAVVVVILAGVALAADSLGLWAWVPRWNAAAGRYEPAAMEVSGESPIPAALAELGITEPVYPEKLPEGFVITESHISEDPLLLVEQYARGKGRLSITVTSIKGVKSSIYQKSGTPVREYHSGKSEHYIFENDETITAVWYTKNFATVISANLPFEEIKRIIDSLYEQAEGGEQS